MGKRRDREKQKAAAAAVPPPPRFEKLRGLAVATLSGVLWFLSCADFDIWPLAWIAMVPTLWLIDNASTARRAVLFGWWTGLVANAGGFYWIISLLERFGGLPFVAAAPLFLMLCAYQAVVFFMFAWALRTVRRDPTTTRRLPMVLVAPVIMVAFELVVPMIFPWYLAITQAWNLHVIQVADLTGPMGVTFLLLMVNGAVYDVVFPAGGRGVAWKLRARPAIAAAVVMAAALGYGALRLSQTRAAAAAAPKIDVGIVQPNVAFDQKGVENPNLAEDQLHEQQDVSRRLQDQGADLIVWTESQYPFAISRQRTKDVAPGFPIRHRVARDERGRASYGDGPIFDVPLVLGAITYDPARRGQDDSYPYNSALMLDRDGNITARFDKIFLLVFGEYIPFLETFPSIRKMLPESVGHFARGKEITTFPFTAPDGATYRLGPLICYEDIIPSFGRAVGKLRPHLLVNITNDAWFGASSEPWEHLALSVYRAVEQRTGLVRAVNTGVSAFIEPTGRVAQASYSIDPAKTPRPADGFLHEMPLMEGGHTVFARFGDWFAWLCAAATLALWQILPRVRRRRARRTTPPPATPVAG